MDNTTIVVINCVCTVAAVVLSMLSMSYKFFKNNLSKADLLPIQDKLDRLEHKIDKQEHVQNTLRERMAIVEFQLKMLLSDGGKYHEE